MIRSQSLIPVNMLVMTPLQLIIVGLAVFAILVIWLVWRYTHPKEAEAWPSTSGTIQSVNTVVVHAGRSSYSVEVADFSYSVDDEYFSGRLTITTTPSNQGLSPRSLIHQTIQVNYDPRRPEKFSIPQTELGGFSLSPHYEPFGEDVDPIDLNIDKA